jgi:hypothetical protein
MENNSEITVSEILHEHMKFLAARASFCKEDYGDRKPEKKADIIEAMENLQTLMNRLAVSEPEDPYLKRLAEDRVFLRLSYDSKLLVLEHIITMRSLQRSIDRLVDSIESDSKLREKMRRSVAWRLFRLLSSLPWAGFKMAGIC